GYQRRADRCDGGAQPPRGEQCDDELGAVGQHECHHIAGGYAARTQHGVVAAHGVEELGVIEVEAVVGDGGCSGGPGGALVGHGSEIHVTTVGNDGFLHTVPGG